MPMKTAVYSLKRVMFEGDAKSVNVKTASGEITVLDHHRPLITQLAACTITITDAANKEHFFPIASGFLEVNRENQAKLIVEEA